MTEKFHSVQIDERNVAHLTITHAKKANILSTEVNEDLIAALKSLAGNEDVRAIVLTGEGERAFVAGADLREMSGLDRASAEAFISRLAELCEAVRLMPQPVIGRVQGWCIGAGLELAMACDMRVAATDAKFTMPEVKMGIPSVIHAALMPRLIGMGRSRRIMLTAETINAATALDWGLVDEVVEPENLDAAVNNLLAPILECTAEAIRIQKQILNEWDELSLQDAIASSVKHFGQSFASGRPQAIMQAFFDQEK